MDDIAALKAALAYAEDIIEGYQLDMRSVYVEGAVYINQPEKGPSLADLGVCQGSIYTNALTTIERIKKGEWKP